MYIEFEGNIEVINNRTQERADLTYYPSGWTTSSKIEGKIFDSDG